MDSSRTDSRGDVRVSDRISIGQGLILVAPRRIELEPVEIAWASLRPKDVLVRTNVTLVSPGTEASWFTGAEADAPAIYGAVSPRAWDQPWTTGGYPVRTGYSNVGEVLAVGQEVDYVAGQRVLTMGRHASIVRIDTSEFAVPVPSHLQPQRAVVARLAGVAITSLRSANVGAGDHVVVIGLGPVGNLAAQLFQIAGCRVLGLDPLQSRREIAVACGVTEVRDPGVGDAVQEVREWVGATNPGDGPRVVIEATGLPSLALQAIEMAGRMGRVVLLGTPRRPLSADITSALARIHWLGLEITSGFEWLYPVRSDGVHGRYSMAENYRQILHWIEAGRLIVEPMVTQVVSPAEAQTAYTGLADDPSNYMGVIIDWASAAQ